MLLISSNLFFHMILVDVNCEGVCNCSPASEKVIHLNEYNAAIFCLEVRVQKFCISYLQLILSLVETFG